MRKIYSLLALSGMAFTLNAQGISFETGTWKEALAKASKEHKLIYLDVYTTWCGPCKVMAATIFPKPEAGAKYNTAFVNYKTDAENGEGIAIAAQYKVDGYPTNLFIDPETQEVVYKVMGATELDDFLARADIALTEQKDPMKWKDYEAKFEKGERDKKFLTAYIEKAQRLDKQSDLILDAYVEKHVTGKPDKATVAFLVEHTKTLDNKAAAILFAHKEQVMAVHPENKDFFMWWSQSLPYATLEKAKANKDEQLLSRIETLSAKYNIDLTARFTSGFYFYRKEFYQGSGNEAKARETVIAEADYLVALSDEAYSRQDEEALKRSRDRILYQLKAMNVPEEKYESSIAATIEKHPDMKRSASLGAAQTLNDAAWKVVVAKGKDKEDLKRAMTWSEKSLEMAKGSESWAQLADTYANLLYLSGQKEKAVDLQEEVVKKAEEAGSEDLDSLRETLARMKSGKI